MDRVDTGFAALAPDERAEALRLTMRATAATVCAVTTLAADGTWRGATVNSMTSVSLSPPSLLVSLNGASRIHAAILASRRFVVTVFASTHREIAAAFADPKRHDERFATGAWQLAENGMPILTDAVANILCSSAATLPFGTHTIIVGIVDDIVMGTGAEPLVYHDGRYGRWSPLTGGI
jgi:flavin reductase (DIM6/NTAB) family NADH-FMN oxidoreductase RutF